MSETSLSSISLASTGRTTTRLGFGCSGLMSGDTNRSASLALLECAYDAGIRHFDVAPMYGFGAAEDCLGEFLQRHRNDVTVTTKFGIAPAPNSTLVTLARGVGKPVLRLLPGLRKQLVSGSQSVLPSGSAVPFTAEQARLSLDTSLRKLRVDHIDLWLLHEASAVDLQDDELLLFLEQAVAGGKIGSFGVGSEKGKISRLLQERPAYCPVLQYEWSVFDETPVQHPAFTLHHRSLTEDFRAVHASLVASAERCERWSQRTGCDVRNPSKLGSLMLKAALVCNPESVILFSSKKPEHILNNAAVAENTTLLQPALELRALVQEEALD